MINKDCESKQEINTEISLKKKKIEKENTEETDVTYVWIKETKTKRLSKKLFKI